MTATVVKRSLSIAGHRTSISLEEPFWAALVGLAERRHLSVPALVSEIDRGRGDANLSSAIRVHLFEAATRSARDDEPDRTGPATPDGPPGPR